MLNLYCPSSKGVRDCGIIANQRDLRDLGVEQEIRAG